MPASLRAFGAFALGILFSAIDESVSAAAGGIALFIALALRPRPRRQRWLLAAAFFVSGLAAGFLAAPRAPAPSTVEQLGSEERELLVLIATFPREYPFGIVAEGGLLAWRQGQDWRRIDTGVDLRFEGDAEGAPPYGATVRIRARLHPFRTLGIAGEYDRVARRNAEGVFLQGRVREGDWVIVRPPGALAEGLARVRGRIFAAAGRLSPAHGGLFAALAVGAQYRLPDAVRAQWRDAGVVHLVAISGLHLGILFLLLRGGWRFVLSRSPWLLQRIPVARLSGVLAIPLLVLYALLTGAQPPVLRALAMVSVTLVLRMFGPTVGGMASLGWAGLLMLAADPWLVFSPSFQLSFAAVFAAIAWSAALPAELEAKRFAHAKRYLTAALAGSLVSTLWTLPLTTFHFAQASLVGVPANLPLIPYVSVLLTPLTFLYALVTAAWPALPLPWFLYEAAAGVALRLAAWFAAVPGAALRLQIDTVEFFLLLALLVAATVARKTGSRRRKRLAWGACGLALLLAGGHEWLRRRAWQDDLRIDVLSVGQGDAVLVSSRGRHMLIDTGGGWKAGEIFTRTLQPYFRAKRIFTLDRLVLTHPHLDHVGGAAQLLHAIPVGELVVAGRDGYAGGHEAVFAAARTHAVPVAEWVAGRQLVWQGVHIAVEHPDPAFLHDREPNNRSLVLRLVDGAGACALLSGDAEAEAERALIRRGALPCALLKAGHHGSRTSSTLELLRAVRPRDALISVGFQNRFRHPHPETLARLAVHGVRIHRTDERGTLTARARRGRWRIRGWAEDTPWLALRELAETAGFFEPDTPPPERSAADRPP